MTCPNCHKPSGDKKYCDDKCLAEYSNNIRLCFYPDLSIDPMTSKLNRRAAYSCLVMNMSLDQVRMFSTALMELASDTMSLVYSQEGAETTRRKIKAQQESKKKDTSTKASIDHQTRVDTVKAQGNKISLDGKCANCGVPSTALLCGPICKAEYKAIQSFIKVGLSITAAAGQIRAANPTASRTILHLPPKAPQAVNPNPNPNPETNSEGDIVQ